MEVYVVCGVYWAVVRVDALYWGECEVCGLGREGVENNCVPLH